MSKYPKPEPTSFTEIRRGGDFGCGALASAIIVFIIIIVLIMLLLVLANTSVL